MAALLSGMVASMTTPATLPIAGPFTGTGADALLPFAFPAYAASDLLVTRDGTVLAEGTHYSVALNADQVVSPGGTVTILAAANTLASEVFVELDMDPAQTTVLTSLGGYNPKTVERALDRLAALVGQALAKLRRAVLVERGATAETTLAELTAALTFDGAATYAASAEASATAAAASALAADTSADAAIAAAATVPTLSTDGTMAANSDELVPSQKAVRTYVNTLTTGLWDFKGDIACAANPNYPAASKGDTYVVTTGGKIGGASGQTVETGDIIIAKADNAGGTEAGVGANWTILQVNTLAAAIVFASIAEVRGGVANNKAIAPDALTGAQAFITLTDAATTNWDMSTGFNAKWTLGGNRTLAVSNPKEGVFYTLLPYQDGTGNRLATWPASFNWGAAGAPTLTTTTSKHDVITLLCTDAATPKFDAFLGAKGF